MVSSLPAVNQKRLTLVLGRRLRWSIFFVVVMFFVRKLHNDVKRALHHVPEEREQE